MRAILAPAIAAALILAACGGGTNNASGGTPATMNLGGTPRPSIAATPAATTAATTPASAAELEVTGIVGGVIVRNNVITVRPLSGASITKINVDAQTAIRSADGGSLSLGEIRPSERIVARGVLNDRGDGLLAREITVQAVVSGGQPGG